MKTLGIILARAGSVGLPNKHLLPLLGKPVIEYTFDYARAASCLTRAVVTTDCANIRNLARRHHFKTINRPKHLATSDASVQDVLLHALKTIESDCEFRCDALVVLYGNVPLREDGLIDRAVCLLQETRCDSVRSMSPVGKWHPSWMWRMNESRITPNEPGSIHRRQDLEPLYLHDGGVIALTRESLLRSQDDPLNPHAFFGADRRGTLTSRGCTVEVDEPIDLLWAEAALRSRAPQLERLAS